MIFIALGGSIGLIIGTLVKLFDTISNYKSLGGAIAVVSLWDNMECRNIFSFGWFCRNLCRIGIVNISWTRNGIRVFIFRLS